MQKTICISRQVKGKVDIDDDIIDKIIDIVFDYINIEESNNSNVSHYAGDLLDYSEEEVAKVMLAIADELKERYGTDN